MIFHKTSGIRSKSGIKRRCSMTSLDWRGLLCRGLSWEIKPCRRKILYSGKQYFPALEADLEPLQACRESRERGVSKTSFHGLLPAAMVAVPCLRRYESMTLVKAGKTFLNGLGRRGKEQTETCPILMEQAPLQDRPGNDALLLGEKNCFFPKSQRQAEVMGENAQGAGKRLPGV